MNFIADEYHKTLCMPFKCNLIPYPNLYGSITRKDIDSESCLFFFSTGCSLDWGDRFWKEYTAGTVSC